MNRERNNSSGSEGGGRQVDQEEDKKSNKEEDESLSDEFLPSDESTPTHPVPSGGYIVPTKNDIMDHSWHTQLKEAEHYTKFMPAVPPANYVGYSKVGADHPTTTMDHPATTTTPCPGYVNNPGNSVSSNAQPSAGYVTFSSVKLGEPGTSPTPGYITVDQVNKLSGEDSKNSPLQPCDNPSLSPTKETPLSPVSPGYSRVGISAPSHGYVPNAPSKKEGMTNEFLTPTPYLDNSWVSSEESSKIPFKPSLGYVQAPLHNGLAGDQKKDDFAEPLLITPRNLAVNSSSPYNEVITRFSEGPAASMV